MSEPRARRDLLALVLLVVVTSGLYWEVSGHGFLQLDDGAYVRDNPHVGAGLTMDGFRWALTTGLAATWHPLTWLSHMLDCELFGVERPGAHHLVSLLLHVINSGLLFVLLRRTTRVFWPALFIAAVFALHPINVESVAWIAERKNVLSTTFWLLCMLAYVRYARGGGRLYYGLAIVLLALGLMAKPMLVTVPFVLLLLDYWPLGRLDPARPKDWLSLLIEKVPMLVLSAASAVVTFVVQQEAGGPALPFTHRLSTALTAYVRYLRMIVWPTDLAPMYPNHPGMWSMWQVLGATLVLGAITLFVVVLHRRRYLTVGWLLYLGTLVPVIGIVAIGAGEHSAADRYVYVPMIGLLIMVAWGAPDLLSGLPRGRLLSGLAAAAVTVAWAAQTPAQVSRWRDSRTLFEHALAVSRDNNVAHTHLGVLSIEAGRVDAAIAHFREALRIDPDDPDVQTNFASALVMKGRVDEAIEQYLQMLERDPGNAVVHDNLGIALARRGRLEEAIEHHRDAVRLSPGFVEAHNNLGVALAADGQIEAAIAGFRRALELRPDYQPARANLRRLQAGTPGR